MKALRDEILLRRETDLISSEHSSDFICIADFILAYARISLYNSCGVIIMAENKLADMSTDFAVRILKLTDSIKGHYSLSNQLERSGTSIGANIRESKYAHSKADFVSKLQISLKECYETEYWIEISVKSGIVCEESVKELLHDCGVIRKLLISSINTVKGNVRSNSGHP